MIAYIISIAASICTGIYSYKIIYYTYIIKTNASLANYKQHETHNDNRPLVVLAILSIIVGYISKEVFVGIGNNSFKFITSEYQISDVEQVGLIIKLLPIIMVIIAVSIWTKTRVSIRGIKSI